MKLDRNINSDSLGKYALLKLREMPDHITCHESAQRVSDALEVLREQGILDWGNTPESEFFVIRLKDQFAGSALRAYAEAAKPYDPEYAQEIWDMSWRSGLDHPNCKRPD